MAEDRYGVDINSRQELNELQWLEQTYGKKVHDWLAEGMPREAMGSPAKMTAFRQSKQPDSEASMPADKAPGATTDRSRQMTTATEVGKTAQRAPQCSTLSRQSSKTLGIQRMESTTRPTRTVEFPDSLEERKRRVEREAVEQNESSCWLAGDQVILALAGRYTGGLGEVITNYTAVSPESIYENPNEDETEINFGEMLDREITKTRGKNKSGTKDSELRAAKETKSVLENKIINITGKNNQGHKSKHDIINSIPNSSEKTFKEIVMTNNTIRKKYLTEKESPNRTTDRDKRLKNLKDGLIVSENLLIMAAIGGTLRNLFRKSEVQIAGGNDTDETFQQAVSTFINCCAGSDPKYVGATGAWPETSGGFGFGGEHRLVIIGQEGNNIVFREGHGKDGTYRSEPTETFLEPLRKAGRNREYRVSQVYKERIASLQQYLSTASPDESPKEIQYYPAGKSDTHEHNPGPSQTPSTQRISTPHVDIDRQRQEVRKRIAQLSWTTTNTSKVPKPNPVSDPKTDPRIRTMLRRRRIPDDVIEEILNGL